MNTLSAELSVLSQPWSGLRDAQIIEQQSGPREITHRRPKMKFAVLTPNSWGEAHGRARALEEPVSGFQYE
jgi:hypothetical protein